MSKGLFITFEGGEGAGKTTQIKRLAETLEGRGYKVLLTREPGGTPEAEKLRALFIDQNGQDWPPEAQLLLMTAARTLHVEKLLRPALAGGTIVLCDRFTDSTLAYQGYAGGMSLDKIQTVQHAAIGDFAPDLTIILDIDPAQGLNRAGRRAGTGDTFEGKALSFHQKIREGFLDIGHKNPGRCAIIDASQDAETIADTIEARVRDKIESAHV